MERLRCSRSASRVAGASSVGQRLAALLHDGRDLTIRQRRTRYPQERMRPPLRLLLRPTQRGSLFARFAVGSAMLASLVGATGCSAADSSDLDSARNGINCDVRLDQLTIDKLVGISIVEPTTLRISPKEKARHLNELNLLSPDLLDVYRKHNVPIYLTGGTVTNFRQFSSLRGTTPRGWEGTGYTWDSVPGTGTEDGIFLGDSAKPNNAASLSIHEGTHAIDRSLDFSDRSTPLNELYREELGRAAQRLDPNANYRRSNIEEFLAVAVEEYYCNTKTRTNLLQRYPSMHNYVKNSFSAEVRDRNR